MNIETDSELYIDLVEYVHDACNPNLDFNTKIELARLLISFETILL